MSGHNKWSKVKHTKGAIDTKRNKLFTKLLREIQVASRLGGDPKHNPRLREAISEARINNMPKENIERAIKRGTGELEGSHYESVIYEGYGPGGAALLIECLTDNRNRTVADLRNLIGKNSGNLGEAGSVSWMFSKHGVISIDKKSIIEDLLMELVLEAGAEDIYDADDQWKILTLPTELDLVKSSLEKKVPILSATHTLLPKNKIKLNPEKTTETIKMIEKLDDLDDVQKVYVNLDLSEEDS